MVENRKKEKIKACIAIAIIILAILITGIITMKYHVEGEFKFNMPFTLSKITVVSTAEGVENKEAEEKWNFSIFQNNDIYFSIEKNEKNNREDIIEKVFIQNIQITKKPKIGRVQAYMPNSLDGRLFSFEEEYILPENKLIYQGASKSNTKTLEIGNQGGTAVIRFANTELGNYISNEEEEIKHDGSLLGKIEVKPEDINFNVEFDFVLQLEKESYTSHICLELPCENNLIEKGKGYKEITEGFIFKRN